MDIEQKITLMLKTNQHDWIALGLQLARQNLTRKQVFRLVYKVIEDMLWECGWRFISYTYYDTWVFEKNVLSLNIRTFIVTPLSNITSCYFQFYRRELGKQQNKIIKIKERDAVEFCKLYKDNEARLHVFISQQTALVLKRFK